MCLSEDRVGVLRADWMHACVAARFLLLGLKLQAKETELMATLQPAIAIVHLVAYLAFLHVCRVLGCYEFLTTVFCWFLLWQDRLSLDLNA